MPDKQTTTPEIEHAVNKIALMIRREMRDTGNDEQSALVDILADVRHFCDARELDFFAVDTQAAASYAAEVAAVPDECDTIQDIQL